MLTFPQTLLLLLLLPCVVVKCGLYLFIRYLKRRAGVNYELLPTDASTLTVSTSDPAPLSKTDEVLGQLSQLALILSYAFLSQCTQVLGRSPRLFDSSTYWGAHFALLAIAVVWTVVGEIRSRKDASIPSSVAGGGVLLNRDQTEEWRGWMQFSFVAYHYFHAGMAYNSMRCFVSAYVWMTGFGNFSYFYSKADFSLIRLLKMLWRLNFFVVFLCATTDNNYFLYYIVPLHSFYFLMVYSFMAIAKQHNHSRLVGVKVVAAAAAIAVVWDVFPEVFTTVFSPFFALLPNGTKWAYEWHFRTFLDHFSSVCGMLFALNFPVYAAWLKACEKLPRAKEVLVKLLVALFWIALLFAWVHFVFSLDKFSFNSVHPYTFFVPVLTYIYFRNLTPWLRSHRLLVLNFLGKITLETYLLQFHLLMTDNASTLLVLVPWAPLNAVIVIALYLLCSHRLFSITTVLGDLIFGKTIQDTIHNVRYVLILALPSVVLAAALSYLCASPAVAVCVALAVAFTVLPWVLMRLQPSDGAGVFRLPLVIAFSSISLAIAFLTILALSRTDVPVMACPDPLSPTPTAPLSHTAPFNPLMAIALVVMVGVAAAISDTFLVQRLFMSPFARLSRAEVYEALHVKLGFAATEPSSPSPASASSVAPTSSDNMEDRAASRV